MNAPAFTPGPWVQGHTPGAHWVNLPGLARGINAGSAANAALIAAAPLGYALAVKVAEHFAGTDAPLGVEARAFLAKARGESP